MKDHILGRSWVGFRAWWCLQGPGGRLGVLLVAAVTVVGLALLLRSVREWRFALEQSRLIQRAKLTETLRYDPARWNEDRRNIHDPDVSGIQLVNREYRRLDLSRVDFSNAQLSGVMFQDCDLSHSTFVSASLSHVRFDRVRLDRFSLDESDVRDVVFIDSRIDDSFLEWTSLEDVLFDRVSLRNAHFHGVKLRRVAITRSDLTGAGLGQPRLVDGLEIRDTKMDGFLYRAFAKEERISIVNSSPCPYPLRHYCR